MDSKLTFVRKISSTHNLYKCDCGKEKVIYKYHADSGRTKSCGCLYNIGNTKHTNYKNRAEYKIWWAMIDRCHNPSNISFKNYGERGITVCDEWRESFDLFFSDIGARPKNYTIDRADNNKGYSKSNCVWSSKTEQARNRRNNVLNVEAVKCIRWVYHKGNKKISDIATVYKLNTNLIRNVVNFKIWKIV